MLTGSLTKEESLSPQQKTLAQPPEPPEEAGAQCPDHNDVTVSAPEQGQALDLDLTITLEPTLEAEYPTELQQTTAPARHTEVALSRPESDQTQQPTSTEVTVPPLDLAFTKT